MKQIKILIADDHRLTRSALKKIFLEKKSFSIVADVGSGIDAIKAARETHPDVILMDIEMDNINGIDATRKILRDQPQIKILILTAHAEYPYPARLLEAGAAGYITKDCRFEELLNAIQFILSGERYITPSIAQNLVLQKTQAVQSPLDALSERELQIMLMLIAGTSTDKIASKLFLTKKTVNTYRYTIFEKLNVENDVGMVLLAKKIGLI
jgi:two-component system, NarL family, invasion response regulator UvrY